MKTVKISLANIQGKLSRVEMKSIMAGSGDYKTCTKDSDCNTGCRCYTQTTKKCMCSTVS